MKRNNSFYNKMMQFGYEHRSFDNAFNQVRKSAEEVNKMLNKMSKKEEKKEK